MKGRFFWFVMIQSRKSPKRLTPPQGGESCGHWPLATGQPPQVIILNLNIRDLGSDGPWSLLATPGIRPTHNPPTHKLLPDINGAELWSPAQSPTKKLTPRPTSPSAAQAADTNKISQNNTIENEFYSMSGIQEDFKHKFQCNCSLGN